MIYLSMIDVTNGTDVDVRLAALKSSSVASRGVNELRLSPVAQGEGDGAGGLGAQSAGGLNESTSERHDCYFTPNTTSRWRIRGEKRGVYYGENDGMASLSPTNDWTPFEGKVWWSVLEESSKQVSRDAASASNAA